MYVYIRTINYAVSFGAMIHVVFSSSLLIEATKRLFGNIFVFWNIATFMTYPSRFTIHVCTRELETSSCYLAKIIVLPWTSATFYLSSFDTRPSFWSCYPTSLNLGIPTGAFTIARFPGMSPTPHASSKAIISFGIAEFKMLQEFSVLVCTNLIEGLLSVDKDGTFSVTGCTRPRPLCFPVSVCLPFAAAPRKVRGTHKTKNIYIVCSNEQVFRAIFTTAVVNVSLMRLSAHRSPPATSLHLASQDTDSAFSLCPSGKFVIFLRRQNTKKHTKKRNPSIPKSTQST